MESDMTRQWHLLLVGGAALAAGACAESATGAADATTYDLSAAFTSIPAGYGSVANSYGSAEVPGGTPWLATGGHDRASFGTSDLMGGGLGEAFVGGIGFGSRRGHHGPFAGALGCAGTFANGRVTCATEARNGLTVVRTAAYADAQGQVQQAFDTLTTNTANLRTTVSGTLAFARDGARGPGFGFGPRGGHGGPRGGKRGRGGHGGLLLGDTATVLTATTTVASASERTVSGLAQGSTQRTVDGTSRAEESTTGTSSRGTFTATRVVGDTTQGLVVPVPASGAAAYPTAGTVIRAMRVTVTYAGETPTTQARREVVTYDGSGTAKVVITRDDVTQRCTRPLPRGPLTCE
jgi:hypothetical protein